MRRLIFLFIFTNFYIVAYNQVINGTIYDSKTKEAINSASAYFNGTSVGTLSDQNGKFKLDISKYPSMPLTVSAIGYYSATIKEFSASKPLLVYLNPKVFELSEVVVKAKTNPLKRAENLSIFRAEFLGSTANSMNCTITNESELRFRNSANDDTLKAYATKPLIINNKSLGYKITYFLDKFEYYKQRKAFVFSGNVIIKDDTTIKGSKKQYIDRKRKNAYLGSRMHFLRALWLDDLNENGFTVRNSANEIVGYNNIVYKLNEHAKYISSYTNLGIAYYTKAATSFVTLDKDKVFFDANGYYDPLSLSWDGEMARQRVADLLPFDYHPN
jgi:hypothetical protein